MKGISGTHITWTSTWDSLHDHIEAAPSSVTCTEASIQGYHCSLVSPDHPTTSKEICKSSWRDSLYLLDALLRYVFFDGQELSLFRSARFRHAGCVERPEHRASDQEQNIQSPSRSRVHVSQSIPGSDHHYSSCQETKKLSCRYYRQSTNPKCLLMHVMVHKSQLKTQIGVFGERFTCSLWTETR